MKSISESIIGKRGNANSIPELQEHDIVVTREPQTYMVLTNPAEIRAGDLNPNDGDKRQGILYRVRPYYGLEWMPLRDYDVKTLEYPDSVIPHKYDIDKVYRGNYKWNPADTRTKCKDSNLSDLIQDHRKYHLIWERK